MILMAIICLIDSSLTEKLHFMYQHPMAAEYRGLYQCVHHCGSFTCSLVHFISAINRFSVCILLGFSCELFQMNTKSSETEIFVYSYGFAGLNLWV